MNVNRGQNSIRQWVCQLLLVITLSVFQYFVLKTRANQILNEWDIDMEYIQQIQIGCIVKLLYKNVLMLVCSNWGISDSIIWYMEYNDIIVNVFFDNQ